MRLSLLSAALPKGIKFLLLRSYSPLESLWYSTYIQGICGPQKAQRNVYESVYTSVQFFILQQNRVEDKRTYSYMDLMRTTNLRNLTITSAFLWWMYSIYLFSFFSKPHLCWCTILQLNCCRSWWKHDHVNGRHCFDQLWFVFLQDSPVHDL